VGRVVVLDSEPLGVLANPLPIGSSLECEKWFTRLRRVGTTVVLPEIVDYEVRRELLRARKYFSIAKLEGLHERLLYLPIETDHMRRGASIWATMRQTGLPMADRSSLDGDVIVAAQALAFESDENEVIVATSNVRHLSRMVPASRWQEIQPLPPWLKGSHEPILDVR
jgi:predicted nucleic acid-binding protein